MIGIYLRITESYRILIAISILLLSGFYTRYSIVRNFSGYMLIFLLLGYIRADYRIHNIDTILLQDPIDVKLRAVIDNIKYNEKGALIYLKDIIYGDLSIIDNMPHRVRVRVKDSDAKRLNIGDYVESYVHLNKIPGPILPDSYDFGIDAYYNRIGAYGYAISKVDVIESNDIGYFSSKLNNLRKYLYYNFIENMGHQSGNFAAALFLGEQRGVDKKILDNMRLTGISHILCVSGMHLSLVTGIFFVISRIFLNLWDFIVWRVNTRNISVVVAILGAFLYLLLSSAGIASVRAFVMTFILMIGLVINRGVFTLRSISIAAFIITFINPEYILYPSFQLSFMAALSLIIGYEFYSSSSINLIMNPKNIFFRFAKAVMLNIYSSIIVTFGTIGIVIYHFYFIPNYVILGNLLTIPIIALAIMPIGILTIILDQIGFGYYLYAILGFFINWIINIADYISKIQNSVYHFGHIKFEYLVIHLFGLFWFIIWRSRVRFVGLIFIALSLFLISRDNDPEILINRDLGFICKKNSDGEIEVIGENVSNFHLNFIAGYFGKSFIIYKNMPIVLDP